MRAAPRRIRSLANRQALHVGLVAIGALILSGFIEMAFSYREALAQTQALQASQATAAAREIEQYLDKVTGALSDTTKLPCCSPAFPAIHLRDDLSRLLVLFDAINDIRIAGADDRELLILSRTAGARLESEGWPSPPAQAQAAKLVSARFGTPYFRNGSEPYVNVELSRVLHGHATMTVTLNLRVVADVLKRLDKAVGGQAYLVDRQDWLIMHPDQVEMLKRRQLSDSPTVGAVRSALAASSTVASTVASTVEAKDFEGKDVVATATFVPKTGWLLILEQSRATVLEPVFATLRRTAVLVFVATLLTAAVSAWSGRRMARPIVELRAASARIAKGDFKTPARIETGDELELLGQDLNQMANRLGSFYQELEEQVAERTEQFLKARDFAERASQAKTRFLAAASHDLRQPMHTIGLLISVLANRLTDAEQLAIAGKLGTTVDTMERLFSSLLDISKLDAGAVQASWETFPVQDLLDRIAQRFEVDAAERGLQLRVHRCGAIVRSDPGLLERCIGNLVANALNYTHTGRVVVGCRRRGQSLAIQVHDTGPGIPTDHLKLIFEEFVRLPAGAASQARGLGLGLAIVHRTAALLGHTLHVKSRSGRGSMFEISLGQLPATTPTVSRMKQEDADDGELRGMFVLVVDDDEGNRAALQALCTRWGCHVATAASAEAALEELGRHLRSPDILLSDMQLGGMLDGLDLVERLRVEADEATPCLLITADTAASVLDRARANGVDVLHKPATADRLYAAACAALKRAGHAAASVRVNA
jgi:signal transduction histidine kinase/CheY-like chemotaxis protein